MKLICYLSNGYPSIEASIKMADEYVSAGCDMIEIDFPSRNPYLEGELIAGRMAKALEVNDNYDDYMEGIIKIKKMHPETYFIVLAYENTICEIGADKYADFIINNGFEDIIYVGDKSPEIKERLIKRGIRVSCYVQFHQPEEEVKAAVSANGFVYVQAKPTANNTNPEYPTLKDCIAHLRRVGITRKIYAGVGIYTPGDVAMAKASGADGVFVGSTILKLHDNLPEMRKVISEMKKALNKVIKAVLYGIAFNICIISFY